MDLNLVLLHQLLTKQEVADILALVALQLNDLAQLGVLHHGAVAAELLLKGLQDLVVVVSVAKGFNLKLNAMLMTAAILRPNEQDVE